MEENINSSSGKSAPVKRRPAKRTKKRAVVAVKKEKEAASEEPALILDSQTPVPVAVSNQSFIPEEIKNDKTARPLGIYRKIALSFIALTLVLLAIIVYFSVIQVTITIIPNQERVSGNLIADIYDKDASLALKDGGATIGMVKQVPVEITKIYETSGKEILGQEVTGKVIIKNNYIKNQPLVATTRLLSSDNKLFRVKNTVNVPANSQVEVEVYADEPSQETAIGPSNFTIPGLWSGLQDKIYGQSKEAMRYDQTVKKYIERDDIDQAVKDLKNNIVEQAKIEVAKNYGDFDQTLYQADNNSIGQEIDGKAGEERDNFSITMKAAVAVIAFNDDKLYQMAKEKLISSLPNNKEIIEFNKKDFIYSLNSSDTDHGQATVNVTYSGKMSLRQDDGIIDKNKLVGLNSEQLAAYLNTFQEIAGYDIKFFPSFIRRVPNLVDRINVEVKK